MDQIIFIFNINRMKIEWIDAISNKNLTLT